MLNSKIESNLIAVLEVDVENITWFQYGHGLIRVHELCGIESGLVTMVNGRPVPIDSRFRVSASDVILKHCNTNLCISPISVYLDPEEKASKINYYRLSNKGVDKLSATYVTFSRDIANIVVSKISKLMDLIPLMYGWSIDEKYIECITPGVAYKDSIVAELV